MVECSKSNLIYENNKEDVVLSAFNIQVALFFKQKCDDPHIFALNLNKNLQDYFNAPPTMLGGAIPSGPDAPPELDNFPVVQMKRTGTGEQFNVAKTRCDVIIGRPGMFDNEKEFFNYVQSFLTYYITEVLKLEKFVRIGVIANAFIQNEDPTSAILKKYFSPTIKGSLSEISFRINKPTQKSGVQLNDLLSVAEGAFEQAQLENNSVKHVKHGILITRDINTLPANSDLLNFNTVNTVLEYAFEKFPVGKIGEVK